MLERVLGENDTKRKEIRSLREQLYAGTSVLESRKSVDMAAVTILQGHNIKLLTLVNIFFMPMTFVTVIIPSFFTSSFLIFQYQPSTYMELVNLPSISPYVFICDWHF